MNFIRRDLLILICLFCVTSTDAQLLNYDYVLFNTRPHPIGKEQGRATITGNIQNVCDTTVEILFKDVYEYNGQKYNNAPRPWPLKKNEAKQCDITVTEVYVKRVDEKEYTLIWSGKKNKSVIGKKDNPTQTKKTTSIPSTTKSVDIKHVISDFLVYIDSIPFFSPSSIVSDSTTIQNHLKTLSILSNDKIAYIANQNLSSFVKEQNDTLEFYKVDTTRTALLAIFLNRYADSKIQDSTKCLDSMASIMNTRIALREANLLPLIDEIKDSEKSSSKFNWKLVGVCVGLILLTSGLLLWYYMVNKSDKRQKNNIRKTKADTDSLPIIQVIKASTSAPIRRQSLDDVYENEAYIKISSVDFCLDSTVRNLYIKNTCIKDIYNMYANDLRNPNNPGEDGCMVLGRWVQDMATQMYDVSLEEIVRPGDDAIFSEYELNFGSKIGIKRSERLKKLRNETGMQYDLTCWVHSHPGLGVFFSNADNNVHHLLKHHTHPHFLTALVIDIFTPQQETGIFTFKKNGMINSKEDITKMYSFEELYRMALESERRSFNPNDYFNTLGTVQSHYNDCYGIQLSNGAIIDMTFLMSQPNGFLGFVHGFTLLHDEMRECIIAAVTKEEIASDSEMLGCFVVTTHCSIPSIRKMVAKYIQNIHFVLVYTSTDGLLTSIPVIEHDMSTSETYYGEQKLEDLKIWTRRRR